MTVWADWLFLIKNTYSLTFFSKKYDPWFSIFYLCLHRKNMIGIGYRF